MLMIRPVRVGKVKGLKLVGGMTERLQVIHHKQSRDHL